jgi:outer membrane protein assembly factor BamB
MNRRTFCRRAGAAGTILGGAALAGCLDRSGAATDGPGTDPATDGTDSTPPDATDGRTDARAPSGTGAWPTFGANAGNTGFRPEATGPASGTIAWTGIGDAPTVLCSPTVADGTVYVGSANNAVHAFDAATGEQRWQFETTSYVETAPAVHDGRVFTADADGVVYAVSADGREAWRHETEQNLHSRGLVAADGTVYVGTAGNMPAVVSGDTDKSKAGTVVALDAATGERQWTYQGPEDWFGGPALGDGRVYVGNHDGSVAALDADTGEAVWSRKPGDGEHADAAAVLAPPTYADGSVYVGLHAAGQVAALDAATGEPAWRAELDGPNLKCSPAVTGDRVYVAATASYGVIPDDDADDETPATPTREPGDHGTLSALDRTDGSTVWTYEAGHDFRSSPAVDGERVYIGGGDGALAVTRDGGREVWRVGFEDFVDSSPAIADGRLFIGSADGNLYCVGEA